MKNRYIKSRCVLLGAIAATGLSMNASALEVIGETLEIYGTVRLSLDYGMTDLDATDDNVSLSSNTTIIGFRGAYDIPDTPYKALWQLEQNFNPGINVGDTFSNRDTFLGVETPYGIFRAGLMDTPFKKMGVAYTIYSTTVADPHGIIGQNSGVVPGGRLDNRGKKALQWDGEFGGLKLNVMYGLDQQSESQYTVDDNDNDMFSVRADWEMGGLQLAAAFVDYSNLSDAAGATDAYRVAAAYAFGSAKVGAIYEDVDSELASLSRAAYGAYLTYRVRPRTTAGLQWMHAEESESGDDAADQLGVVVYHAITQKLLVHAAYSLVDNESNGQYRVGDWAHGVRQSTVPGGESSAFSVGAQLSF